MRLPGNDILSEILRGIAGGQPRRPAAIPLGGSFAEGERLGLPEYSPGPPLAQILKAIAPQPEVPTGNAVPYPMNNVVNGLGRAMPDIVSGAYHVPSWQAKRDELQRGAFMPAPIKPRSPVSGKDFLPIAAIAALASLLGADENDLSQGLQGFVGARQGIVGQEFEQAQQMDQMKRQGMLNEANQYGQKIDKAEAAKAENDKFLRDLKVLDIKAKNEAAEKDKDRRSRETIATGKDRVSAIKGLLAKANPEGRSLLAGQLGIDDPGVIEALRQLNESEKNLAAKTQTENEMRPGKVKGLDLKNEMQSIINEFLPEEKRAGINLKDAQVKNYESLIQWRPAYVNIALKKLDLAMMLGANTVGNTQYDNELQGWKAGVDPKVTALQEEMKGHVSRQKELIKNIQALQEAGEDTGTLGEELARVNSRVKQITDRLKEIGDSAPIYRAQPPGVVQPPPTGSVNLPPSGNQGIDKSGFQSFGTMDGKAHTANTKEVKGNPKPTGVNSKGELTGDMAGGTRLPGGGVMFPPTDNKTTKKTTTTKQPAKKTPVAKDTKKPVKLKSGWGT